MEKDYWKRAKIFTGVASLIFSGVLAAFIGTRLSKDALAVLAGAACGVGAAIPTSLLIVAITRWRNDQQQSRSTHLAQPQSQPYPSVVVIPPHQGSAMPYSHTTMDRLPAKREFTVVGEE